ncbi:MAG: cytochrome c oxidase subunit II [bacterium]
MPPEASVWAADHDLVFWVVTAVTGLFFVAVGVVITLAIVKGRRARPLPPPSRRTERRLEAAWIILPLVLGLAIFAFGAERYLALARPPADALQIMVVGKRYMWRMYHPAGRAEINDLHVPAGRPVRLILASDDVIHSLYLPAFRIKQDAVPGRYTDLWFEATAPGEYLLLCTEFCGTEHSEMGGRLVVMAPDDYDAWARRDPDQPTPVERGAAIYARMGCESCHGIDAAVAAPRLHGIWDTEVELADGRTVRVDDDYLRRSILRPAADVVAGHQPLMPAYQGRLDEGEVLALIAYIRSLSDLTMPGAEAGP